jgi:aminoglycoside phosphotransferase (APT) family kinase protein
MGVMHGSGKVQAPRPLWLEEDADILGAPFFIMEKALGRVPVSIPPYSEAGWVAEAKPEQRRRMWENGVRQLAAIQSVPVQSADFLAGPPHAREGLEQEFDKYSRIAAWVQEGQAWPVLDQALGRLRDLWPEHRPAGIVWGDARIGNMMFDENFEVCAVVDWEQPSLGGALNDLAWWVVNAETMHGASGQRSHLAGMGTREETIALWESETGISAAGIEWYEDFTHFKMSCLGIRMAALRGAAPPEQGALARRLKVA